MTDDDKSTFSHQLITAALNRTPAVDSASRVFNTAPEVIVILTSPAPAVGAKHLSHGNQL